ncbi:mannuronate-specific alginate lyase [Candidatus Pantoea multigeneris]|nr:mannuronate-specific alginate lyase [Pantoea multigeneris]
MRCKWLITLVMWSSVLLAAEPLVPPPGYFAPVHQQHPSPFTCPAFPMPYTGALRFTSKYQGSDAARATLNLTAEQDFRQQTQSITRLEQLTSQLTTRFMRSGNAQTLNCLLTGLNQWAQADALSSLQTNYMGRSERKWALATLSSNWLRLRFSSSHPLAGHITQQQQIDAWLGRLADLVVQDWGSLPLQRINNHSYWAAWAVMSSAVVTNRRDLFEWATGRWQIAASQTDAQGMLPNELRRRQRALSYHNYALEPLVMIARFAAANQVRLPLRPLRQLSQNVIDGIQNATPFQKASGYAQLPLRLPQDVVWLLPYCTLLPCTDQQRHWLDAAALQQNRRLGGDLGALYLHEQKNENVHRNE